MNNGIGLNGNAFSSSKVYLENSLKLSSNFTKGQTFSALMTTKCSWG